MKVLFVCNQGKHRSRTAAELFTKFDTKFAGLFNESPVTAKEMMWADVVIVMEDHQRRELSTRHPSAYLQKRILSLDVPDIYQHGQPELQKLLSERMNSVVEPLL